MTAVIVFDTKLELDCPSACDDCVTVRSGMANIRGHGYGYRDVERHDEGLDEALVEAAADRCGRAFRSIKE